MTTPGMGMLSNVYQVKILPFMVLHSVVEHWKY